MVSSLNDPASMDRSPPPTLAPWSRLTRMSTVSSPDSLVRMRDGRVVFLPCTMAHAVGDFRCLPRVRDSRDVNRPRKGFGVRVVVTLAPLVILNSSSAAFISR